MRTSFSDRNRTASVEYADMCAVTTSSMMPQVCKNVETIQVRESLSRSENDLGGSSSLSFTRVSSFFKCGSASNPRRLSLVYKKLQQQKSQQKIYCRTSYGNYGGTEIV